ncbi:MAG TPA: Ig-like domain-containing protein, partial [Bryobacteraceae bacterium]|nr:Ig-like domain-containing protein [Bryobacteraceae bacterium]
QDVTLTATISSTSATGTVTFTEGSAVLGTANIVNGVASFDTSALGVGTHSVTAMYSGDAGYAGSTSAALSQVVNRIATTTTLSSSFNPSTSGQAVTFTATVTSAAATGTVTFMDGTTVLFTASLVGGSASYTSAALAVGTHTITAVYSGDDTFAASTSAPLTQTVNPQLASTTTKLTSAGPSMSGQKMTFTATVSSAFGVPTGTITFMDGSTVLGTATLKNGVATFSISTLSVGTHTITAIYSGNATFQPSASAPLTETVTPQPGNGHKQ